MLSNQQELFISFLYDLGDRDLARDRMGIDIAQLVIWLRDTDFYNAVREAEAYYLDQLTARLGTAGLKQLEYVLSHGITTETVTHSEEDVYGHIGDREMTDYVKVGVKQKTVKKIQKQRYVMSAITQAIRLYLLNQMQNDMLNSIKNLAAQGMLPNDSEMAISGLMEEFNNKARMILKGDRAELGITDELLAEIQQKVISG